MIELQLTTAIMLYLSLALGTILTIWIWAHFSRKEKKIVSARQALWTCEYCQMVYLDKAATKAPTQCPRCHSYNKKNTCEKTAN